MRYRERFHMTPDEVEYLILNRPEVFFGDLQRIQLEEEVAKWSQGNNVIQSSK